MQKISQIWINVFSTQVFLAQKESHLYLTNLQKEGDSITEE